jgi:DNA-binding IclR family transcriptional regulator
MRNIALINEEIEHADEAPARKPKLVPGDGRKGGKESNGNKYAVTSVEKLFSIIEVMARSGTAMSLSDIAAAVNDSRSTVHRFMRTMESCGYVRQNEVTKKYYLSYRFLGLGHQVSSRDNRLQKLIPLMFRFAQKMNVFVTIYLIDGLNAYVANTASPESKSVKHPVYIGTRIHWYASAVGKLALALAPEEEVEHYLENKMLTPLTNKTIISRTELRKHLGLIREQGYSVSEGEMNQEDYAIAFPIFDIYGNLFAAISFIVEPENFGEVAKPDVIQRVMRDIRSVEFV